MIYIYFLNAVIIWIMLMLIFRKPKKAQGDYKPFMKLIDHSFIPEFRPPSFEAWRKYHRRVNKVNIADDREQKIKQTEI